MNQAQLFADIVVELLRHRQGREPERLDPDEYFANDALRGVPWLPGYVYRTADQVWAFELARDDFLSRQTLDSMSRAAAAVDELTAVVLVPVGEPYELIARECGVLGIPLVIWTGTRYDFLPVDGAGELPAPSIHTTRIPPNLADKMATLLVLRQDFSDVLCRFSEAHRTLRERPRNETDRDEQRLLKETFRELIAVDRRYVGGHDPLEVLRTVEQWSLTVGASLRDHYYHSFHNFLLGCVAIDGLHAQIREAYRDAFPSTELSIEYIWLLTALYHDVGYLVQRGRDVKETLYGIDISVDQTGKRLDTLADHEASERNKVWQSIQWKIHRRQLVSLYEHLTQETIQEDWTGETLLATEVPNHALDRALGTNFMSADGHGAAGCLRMLMDIERRIRGADVNHESQQFLMKHAYAAALSIPFHDGRLRDALRNEGIDTMSTRRFPLASLLMFIDSIQDARRDPSSLPFEERDALQDLEVRGDTVRAIVDLGRIPAGLLPQKRIEAQSVIAYLAQDGIQFHYPPELLRQS